MPSPAKTSGLAPSSYNGLLVSQPLKAPRAYQAEGRGKVAKAERVVILPLFQSGLVKATLGSLGTLSWACPSPPVVNASSAILLGLPRAVLGMLYSIQSLPAPK